MISNTESTADGIEVYVHKIFELADEYIANQLNGDREQVRDYFPDMLMYISDRIQKPPNEDIELLDKIFDVYVRLCTKYKQLPTLESFSWLVKINRATFTDWKSGEYRSTTHSTTVKKWFDTCKSFAVNRLINKGGVDANLIFACKAAYGMTEAAPIQTANPHQIATRTPEEIAASYGMSLDDSELELPEWPEF